MGGESLHMIILGTYDHILILPARFRVNFDFQLNSSIKDDLFLAADGRV